MTHRFIINHHRRTMNLEMSPSQAVFLVGGVLSIRQRMAITTQSLAFSDAVNILPNFVPNKKLAELCSYWTITQ